jgi:hypothetical protein
MEEAILKSFCECMNSIQLFDIDLQELINSKRTKDSIIMNHIYYYLNPKNATKLNWIKQSKLLPS